MTADPQFKATQRRTLPRRHGRSRGQSLVEFSLVIIPLFIIIFSTIEFALILASIGSFNFAARDAARLGSLLGRTDANADSAMVAVVRAHVQGLVMAKTHEIDIYKATADGTCLDTNGNPTASVDDAACLKNVYLLDGSVKGGTSVVWPVSARNDTLQDADYLGVRVLYQYTYLTGFIASLGTPLNLSATSVQRIEPQDYQGGWRAPHQPLAGRATSGRFWSAAQIAPLALAGGDAARHEALGADPGGSHA